MPAARTVPADPARDPLAGTDLGVFVALAERSPVATVVGRSEAGDPTIRVVFANSAFERLTGHDPAVIAGEPAVTLVGAGTEGTPDAALRGDRPTGRLELVAVDGRRLPVEATYVERPGADGTCWFAATYRSTVTPTSDTPELRRAERLLAEQADLLEAIARGAPLEITLRKITEMIEQGIGGTACAVGMLDTDGTLRVRAAPSLPRQVINLLDELAPRSAAAHGDGSFTQYDLSGDERFARIEALVERSLMACRVSALLAPGSSLPIGALSVFTTTLDELSALEQQVLQRATNLAAIAIERRRFESTLEYQALYDNLTGLPNRTLLVSRIADALDRSARLGTGAAVLFFDIDRFKVVNDSLGHEAGDVLLQMIAGRLRAPLRPGDTLGRFGGDEFMVVCNRVTTEVELVATAERFIDALRAPFVLDGGEVFVTASIGISIAAPADVDAFGPAPVDPVDPPRARPEQLIRDADVAMYRAKDQGRDQYVVFQELVDQRKVDQLPLEQALRNAIEGGELELYFQPVVELADGRMTHAEALVRWHRPGHGLVMPGLFIPLAEETGLVVPLGWWVLHEACDRMAVWPPLPDGSHVEIAVNLSARQLAAPELLDEVSRALDRTGIDPHRLCFEITESDLVDDIHDAVRSLNHLAELGVQLSIDDFGTGYASLEYIRHFTMADYLKIDRSFVDGVEKASSHERAICEAAIGMARSLGLRVIAEGVETEPQLRALHALGCDFAQGYLFSRPVPVADAIAVMAAPPTIDLW